MYRAELDRVYGRFLELPTFVVVVVLWAGGALLELLGVVELYALYWNGMALEQVLEIGF